MLILVIRAFLLYLLVIFALRLMGKKQLGELQPSELVSTILVSNIATISLEDPNLPMLAGVIPILLIVSLDVFISLITLKRGKARKILSGSPRVLIAGGRIDQKEMKSLRFTIDDLYEAMRDAGVFDVSQVQYAIVETTGKINFLEKAAAQAADPPVSVIKDGELCENALDMIGRDDTWLRQTLFDNDIARSQVFLMTACRDGTYNLIKKEEAKRTKAKGDAFPVKTKPMSIIKKDSAKGKRKSGK
jgi:uncharacterized membrane protein YcaP (DUF421 family)